MEVPALSTIQINSTELVGGGWGYGMNSSSSSFLPDPPTNSPHPPELPAEVVHGRRLRAVYLWVLVGVGVPANTACVFTVLLMATPPYYVALLALADTLALATKLLFHQVITHRALTHVSCVFFHASAFFGCYANWVLILISLERFVAVCFPFKKQQLFTKKRIVVSVVGLTVSLLVIFTPVFFFYEDVKRSRKDCVVRESMRGYKEGVWGAGLFSALYFFVPFVLVSVLTAVIIRRLQVIRQRRMRSRTSSASGSGARGTGAGGHSGPEHAVSVMLVSASLIFLVLVLPACLYHVALKHRFDMRDLQDKARAFLFYQVVTVLADTSHAVNFFVYFLSAAKFRAAFVDMLQRCCPCWWARCKGRKPAAVSSHSNNSKSLPLTATVEREQVKDTEQCDTML
ncbi:uncharacterized protein LOC143276046 [Babylonia areolata]|uniref:uncharacterized protein LOC143276046 n=1 Tax=Babylonia areolata TaxID=304850 RepID=UPI003FCFBA04